MTFAGRQTPTRTCTRHRAQQQPTRTISILPGLLLALLLCGCVGSFQPISPSSLPPRAALTPITGQSLVHHCHTALPRAHPWRARQLKSALIRYQLSRAYYPTATRMSQRELDLAARQEREAWSLLWETCQPLLADAR
jgi:hypothetical protein